MKPDHIVFLLFLLALSLLGACSDPLESEEWDFQLLIGEEPQELGTLIFSGNKGVLKTLFREIELKNVEKNDTDISAELEYRRKPFQLEGTIKGDQMEAIMRNENESYILKATRFREAFVPIDRSGITYLLADGDLREYEQNIDHAGMLASLDGAAFGRGEKIYNGNCINCHGTPEIDGSIPLSKKFWSEAYKAGADPYSLYQTLSKGYGSMPPQVEMTPQEKYDVIHYIREEFIRKENPTQYYRFGKDYLASLPKGTATGPESKPYHPWKDQDYGNFFINTYEIADLETGPERYHSPRPVPYADEDYRENNFAYKGIAVRLDRGPGGVAKGKAWMVFDHDLMRVAGGWTGEGFIDWKAILLNDEHETYPRNIGDVHFQTPVGPGWVNPWDGTLHDPRFTARDGRQFGPLPKKWADYKGLYYYEGRTIISYTVGGTPILEELGMEAMDDQVLFTRTLNIEASEQPLRMLIAPDTNQVALVGEVGKLERKDGYTFLSIPVRTPLQVKLLIAKPNVQGLAAYTARSPAPEDLYPLTRGGRANYPEVATSTIVPGQEDGPFAVDQMLPPFDNPWNARMKLSGLDFLSDPNQAVACATDGDVWLISGLANASGQLEWRRIAAGLFQPLGIKVLDGEIFVTCRDQLVRLHDLNGDGETDFYESYNHDHQVSDHFHEFAMGLQVDDEGNLYYAKSGRHAREALIPQHGTLLKVSKDGAKTEIIAKGFRAANGVCLNPDGSFIVTDQQGYWNPMNRINWVEPSIPPKFYGNMWGYDPPADSSRSGMEPPMVWVDMEFDRSPSELLWVDSEAWGPLNGSLLSFSYGYGIIQVVPHEKVNGQMQGGVATLPGIRFMTGVMRGRFHPVDGHLYACGMSAWATNQMMKGGGLYRIRYTGKPLAVPLGLEATTQGMVLRFAEELDAEKAIRPENYEVQTWGLKRTRRYGSDRYDRRTLAIESVDLMVDGKSVRLNIPDITPVDVMTIAYRLADTEGNPLEGEVQNTIHQLKATSDDMMGHLK
jgi:cytochrome c5